MIKIILVLIGFMTLSAAAGFDEEGFSKRSCDHARKDALFLAKSNCVTLGAEDSQRENFSRCRNVDGKHYVTVSYNCQLPKEDDDGYDPDYAESTSPVNEI